MAEGTRPIVVLRIASWGGDLQFPGRLTPAIARVRAAGGLVAAYVEVALGIALEVALLGSPITAHPAARIGYTMPQGGPRGAAFWQYSKMLSRIAERRPQADRAALAALAYREVSGERAEGIRLIDGVCHSLPHFVGPRSCRKE